MFFRNAFFWPIDYVSAHYISRYVAYSTLVNIQYHYESTSKERRHALGMQLKNLEFDTLSFLQIDFHLQFVKEAEMVP